MCHAAHVAAVTTAIITVHRLHGFHRGPVRDGGKLSDVASYLPELLHAEAARLLLDLEDAVLVVVLEVIVGMLLAGPPEPDPREDRFPVRSGRQNLLLASSIGLQIHPHLPFFLVASATNKQFTVVAPPRPSGRDPGRCQCRPWAWGLGARCL